MISRRSSIVVALSLLTMITVFPRLSAAQPDPLTRYTPLEIAEYRDAIRQTFTIGHEIARMANNAATQRLVEQRLKLVESISDGDLARLMSSGADFAQLRAA